MTLLSFKRWFTAELTWLHCGSLFSCLSCLSLRKQAVTVQIPFSIHRHDRIKKQKQQQQKTLLWNAISQRPQQWLISLCCNTEVKVEPMDTTTEVFQWHKKLNIKPGCLSETTKVFLICISKQVCFTKKIKQSVEKVHVKVICTRFEWITEFKLQCIL